MPELFDASDIPDGAEHWDALSDRVASAAMRHARGDAFGRLAQSRAGWLAASLLLGASVAFMLIAANSTSGELRAAWADALSPGDYVGSAMVSPDNPPDIGVLLIGGAGGGR